MDPQSAEYLSQIQTMVHLLPYPEDAGYVSEYPLGGEEAVSFFEGAVALLPDPVSGYLALMSVVNRGVEPNPTLDYYHTLLGLDHREANDELQRTPEYLLIEQQTMAFSSAWKKRLPMIGAIMHRSETDHQLIPQLLVMQELTTAHGLAILKYRIRQTLRGNIAKLQ
jgi:hypothetical protein